MEGFHNGCQLFGLGRSPGCYLGAGDLIIGRGLTSHQHPQHREIQGSLVVPSMLVPSFVRAPNENVGSGPLQLSRRHQKLCHSKGSRLYPPLGRAACSNPVHSPHSRHRKLANRPFQKLKNILSPCSAVPPFDLNLVLLAILRPPFQPIRDIS